MVFGIVSWHNLHGLHDIFINDRKEWLVFVIQSILKLFSFKKQIAVIAFFIINLKTN